MFRIDGGYYVYQGTCLWYYSCGFFLLLFKCVGVENALFISMIISFIKSQFLSPIMIVSFPSAVAVLNISSNSTSKFLRGYFEESSGR